MRSFILAQSKSFDILNQFCKLGLSLSYIPKPTLKHLACTKIADIFTYILLKEDFRILNYFHYSLPQMFQYSVNQY